MKTNRLETLLTDLLSIPTAPFRESLILEFCEAFLEENKIPFFFDKTKNLVVGTKSKAAYLKLLRKKKKEELRVFIAHTDHPGFHVTERLSQLQWKCEWHGGSPSKELQKATFWISDGTSYLTEKARFLRHLSDPTGRGLGEFVIEWDAKTEVKPTSLFGGFSFRAPVWGEGELIYTKAADDLTGVYTILQAAHSLYTVAKFKKHRANFIGLLSRAEEVGFIGAIAHLEECYKTHRDVMAVSLEASRTLPLGAEIGKGPVMRLGDRFTVFDTRRTERLIQIAEKVVPNKYQKRIMDGGSCEASAAVAYGLPTIAMSVPLGNYHNQNLEGGPDAHGGVGPEFVNRNDLDSLVKVVLSVATEKFSVTNVFVERRKKFKNSLKNYKKYL